MVKLLKRTHKHVQHYIQCSFSFSVHKNYSVFRPKKKKLGNEFWGCLNQLQFLLATYGSDKSHAMHLNFLNFRENERRLDTGTRSLEVTQLSYDDHCCAQSDTSLRSSDKNKLCLLKYWIIKYSILNRVRVSCEIQSEVGRVAYHACRH